MRNALVILALVVMVFAGLYFYKKNNPPPKPKEATIVLHEQNNSGQSGVATFAPTADGRVMVRVKITGSSATSTEPVHIHAGRCARLGQIVYDLNTTQNGALTQVLVENDGRETTWEELKGKLPLAINVHAGIDQPEIGIYSACGDVVL